MTIKAVIFDMDGLLLDTETLSLNACFQAAVDQNLNKTTGEKLQHLMLGTSKEKTEELFKHHIQQLDLNRFWAVYDDYMNMAIERGIPHKPFAFDLLQWLRKKGFKIGLCSGNERKVVDVYLRTAGMRDFFSEIVAAGDDLRLKSKPAPDMYLKTAELLFVHPAECLVLEDSPNGLRAGHAAGMTTVMIPDSIPYTQDLEPVCDAVFGDLSKVPAYLESLICP